MIDECRFDQIRSVLPFLVLLDDSLECFARVPIVSNSVVGGRASTAELFTSQFCLVVQLHIFFTLNQCTQSCSFGLQRLVDWVLMHLEDKDILLDSAVVGGLDGDHNKHTKLLPDDILLASGTELLITEVGKQGLNRARAHRNPHEARRQVIALVVTDHYTIKSELQASLHIELHCVQVSPVFLANIGELHEELVGHCVLICPFLGAELLLEEVRVEDDCGTEEVRKVGWLASLRSDQVLSKHSLIFLDHQGDQ